MHLKFSADFFLGAGGKSFYIYKLEISGVGRGGEGGGVYHITFSSKDVGE